MTDFNEKEKKVLRYLYALYSNGTRDCKRKELLNNTGLILEEWRVIQGRFATLGIFDQPPFRSLITDHICQYISELENRPPVNRWKRFTDWYFSKWWSIPLTIIVVGGPIIVQWIMWIYGLCKWWLGEPPKE